MAMKGSGGGGFGSRVVTERPIRTGSGSYATTPGYAGQLGQAQGTHVTRGGESNYRGEPMHSGRSFNPTKYGNEIATNVGRGGPGAGRTLYGQAGSQGVHGGTNSGNPRPQGRDILSSYGPESRRRNRGNPNRSDTDADF
jgi:hypothetical protein